MYALGFIKLILIIFDRQIVMQEGLWEWNLSVALQEKHQWVKKETIKSLQKT